MLKSKRTIKLRMPLVSVIMPVFNMEEYVEEAIISIINQTYKKIELILVDDASSDKSSVIIKYYARLYPNIIKTIRISKTSNAAGNGAFNAGLRKARGQFVARMDADDVSKPERIAHQVNYLIKNPKVVILGTQAEVINSIGETTGQKTVPVDNAKIKQAFSVRNAIIHPSVMYRRSSLPNPNKIYHLKYGMGDDYYTFFGLMKTGKFSNLNEFLIKYRVHNKNSTFRKPRKDFIDSIKIRKAAVSDFGYKISLKSYLIIIAQGVCIFLLPEKIAVKLYFIVRGMIKPKINLHSLITSPKIAFRKIYSFLGTI